MALDLFSEPFAASGGIDARSSRRAIGKPVIGFWELFLRETLQNSWDARQQDNITYTVDGIKLNPVQMDLLRTEIFTELPSNALGLEARLATRTFRLLVVADGGTRGLGGQTRADTAVRPGQSTDFIDFVRNIGRAESKRIGGGTYGFGKGVLYDASDVDTCMVYSQTVIDGVIENRFICMSVGEELVRDGNRFTGRHWWGDLNEGGILEPLTGAVAREHALLLGLAKMAPDETGTSIAVIEPVLNGDQSIADVIGALSEAALMWAWPHMLMDEGGRPSIDFAFCVNGERLPQPDPTSDPQFAQFARAFGHASQALASEQVASDWPWVSKRLESIRPRKQLGALAYRSYTPPSSATSLKHTHHVALMRSPLFVVKYLEVPEDPNGQAIAGVFLADPSQDTVFAKAEPVAHDDWIPASLELEFGETNLVRLALNRIRDEFHSRSVISSDGVGEENAAGIASLSRQLGSLLASVTGPGADGSMGGASGTSRSGSAASRGRGVSVRLGSDVILSKRNGHVVASFPFSIATATGADLSQLALTATPFVVLEGGSAELEGPSGAAKPELLGWFSNNEEFAGPVTIPVQSVPSRTNTVQVIQPPGIAIGIDIKVVSIHEVG